MTKNFKSGFIALIGRPNVGKSTFINQIIGQKVTIVSDKPQTTRHKIQAIYNEPDTQIVFIDTPGVHKPKHELGRIMVNAAENTLNEVDAIIFMIDAKQGFWRGDQYIIDLLKNIQRPVYLVINKIDLIHPDELLPLIDEYRKKMEFTEIIPISALKGNNISRLLQLLKKALPEGPKYYPEGYTTDQPERFIVAEFIREKVLLLTREEIPHSITVNIENIEEKPSELILIQATIVTERDSQKGIIIGKRGQRLKEIGKKSREDLERLLGSKVYLELWVKVKRDWRNDLSQLRSFGYEDDSKEHGKF